MRLDFNGPTTVHTDFGDVGPLCVLVELLNIGVVRIVPVAKIIVVHILRVDEDFSRTVGDDG